MRIAGIEYLSCVDGPGLRNTLFTQGCFWDCPGCHNPQTHDFTGGKETTIYEAFSKLTKGYRPEEVGITFSGGDPVAQWVEVGQLARMLKEAGYNIWCYTGFLWEELGTEYCDLLRSIDVIVDGRFDISLKSMDLRFRGSSNQRIIDVQKSMESGKVVLWEEDSNDSGEVELC